LIDALYSPQSAGLTKEEKQARKDQEKREKDLAKVAAKVSSISAMLTTGG